MPFWSREKGSKLLLLLVVAMVRDGGRGGRSHSHRVGILPRLIPTVVHPLQCRAVVSLCAVINLLRPWVSVLRRLGKRHVEARNCAVPHFCVEVDIDVSMFTFLHDRDALQIMKQTRLIIVFLSFLVSLLLFCGAHLQGQPLARGAYVPGK